MLTQLTIQNFGLIDALAIEFSPGLNVFTGETGAGKSIIVDALRCSLGDRMGSSLVRDASRPCMVETVFDLFKNKTLSRDPIFSDFLPDGETTLIIRRSFLPDGRSKTGINGLAVTVSQLKEIGDRLVDLHGPHDHQLLFSESSHIDIIDTLSETIQEKTLYSDEFKKYASLKKEFSDLESLSSSREVELETLSHRIKELEQVPLDESAYNSLLEESSRVANAEKLYELAKETLDILADDETGISSCCQRAFAKMRSLAGIDPSLAQQTEALGRVQENCDEVISELTRYLDSLSFSPQEAAEINRKYDIYYDILRKYGSTVDDARKTYLSMKEKYDLLSDIEHNTSSLAAKIAETEKTLDALSAKITYVRKKTAKALRATIEKELKDLGIPDALFECRVDGTELSVSGKDKVAFYISPNKGEDLKPLAKIVSSGEAARVMLALKKALTNVDPVPCLVFDEIDSHIGGRLGTVTGKKLKELSSARQVLLITHLPQIASFADRHIKVAKTVVSGKTSVAVSVLEGDAKTDELAKMMSGETESRIALTHAKDMLKSAKK
jgi:DNA repair protein RecN (Recombination protein N)